MSLRAKVLIASLGVALAGLGFAISRAMSPSPGARPEPVPVAEAPRPPAVPATAPMRPHEEAPAAPVPAPTRAPVVVPPDEAHLMARLRAVKDKDPALAVELARQGGRRFPDSPDAPERASILIHALGDQGLASKARGEAEFMVNHYPDSTWVREIEQFTGAHRHRNVRVTDAGLIEYY